MSHSNALNKHYIIIIVILSNRVIIILYKIIINKQSIQPNMQHKPQSQRNAIMPIVPPPRLQHNKPRSNTNYRMHTTDKDVSSGRQVGNSVEDQSNRSKNDIDKYKNKKYSQSFSVLKPSTTSREAGKNNKSGAIMQPKLNKKITTVLPKSLQSLNSISTQNNLTALRSKMFPVHHSSLIDASSLHPTSTPYDNLIKQLNIRLPTPSEKFKQFIEIAPFNRLKNHTEFISHILQRVSEFFRMHPIQIVSNIARKIVPIKLHSDNNQNQQNLDNWMLILHEGQCEYSGRRVNKGELIVRNGFKPQLFRPIDQHKSISVIGLPNHEYSTFVSQYLNVNMPIFKKFIESIQIFKIFTEQAMQKIFASITLNFYSKGENLYTPGQPADHLYLIYEGSAARKIIVQIDKTNKIPLEKFSKLVKVLSRSYEHKIRFKQEDLVGVADIIEGIQKRSENIVIDENTTIITIDRIAVEQNLDEYIVDRLKKYNMKKYPKNYDELCENYLKQKIENRKTEQRKIAALKDEINRDCNNERKSEKIHSMIKIYQERIKVQEREHLIDRKKIERIVHTD